MRFELMGCKAALLREIAMPEMKRIDIAKTYAMAVASSEEFDWAEVNQAIVDRWSPYALDWIKRKVWSGTAFEEEDKA